MTRPSISISTRTSPVPVTERGPLQGRGTVTVALQSLEVRFAISCAAETQLALPISYNDSPASSRREPADFHRIAYVHMPTDPRIVIRVTSAHPVTVVVRLPTLWGMLGLFFRIEG